MSDPSRFLPLKPADFHALLVLMDGPLHGYGIMKAVEHESRGEVRLELGSLYRLLGRLLTEGLLDMGDDDGRRRDYSLTPFGRKVLKAEAQRLAYLMGRLRARKLLPGTDV